MLLSVVCGLAILLAGGVLLVQLLNRSEVIEPSPIGEVVSVADMDIIVESTRELDGYREVLVRIGGVDDAGGAEAFRMIAAARPAPLIGTCGATTVEPVPCLLVFEVGAEPGSRQLIYERGDQSARWVLDTP